MATRNSTSVCSGQRLLECRVAIDRQEVSTMVWMRWDVVVGQCQRGKVAAAGTEAETSFCPLRFEI